MKWVFLHAETFAFDTFKYILLKVLFFYCNWSNILNAFWMTFIYNGVFLDYGISIFT